MKLFTAIISIAAMVILVTLGAVSAGLASRELSAAFVGPDERASSILFWTDPPVALPISSGSRHQRRLLSSCLFLLSSQGLSFQAAEVRQAITDNCAIQAHHAQASGLELAEIHAVLAVEQLAAGDLAAVDQMLRHSLALAPTDLAMILYRIRIGLLAFSPEQLTQNGGLLEGELPVLIGSGRGVTIAASLYVQMAELRPIVDRIADALPALDRQRFLNALRREIRG
ncbi:hypothetical protein [Yoonia vestfoldensis]|uniref:Uncharacterized protein n=1 Tax=Yoonia vestfoldensis TaxID=245188 RepID=A0A1Y0EC08_9RHOB|nr:hypothetical protein [Yoonia vestfoldensis]ARU00911.1 hypothetical protein LOKVESSMR4R_01595 [Yoonia vestfoldensis]